MKKSKKAQGIIVVIILIALAVIAVGAIVYAVTKEPTTQATVQVAEEVAAVTKAGDIASIGVYVRDISRDDVNTKVAVAFYCQSADGSFIIDGSTSSTSSETTGKTTIGDTVTCYAFNSSYQTVAPEVVTVDSEVEHIVIDAYQIPTSETLMDLYDDTLTVSDSAVSNLSVGADGSDSYSKLRLKNNNTNTILPVGGFYVDVNEATNISNIDMSGIASLSGFKDTIANDAHATTNLVISTLSTGVTARKSLWEYVFEFDDDSATPGNQPLLLEANDYVETGSVIVESAVGCTAGQIAAGGSRFRIYLMTAGYYRQTKADGIGYGVETDASPASVISTDLTGSVGYCA
jgi:hypothetical protein